MSPPPNLPRPRQRRISDKGEELKLPSPGGRDLREGDKMIHTFIGNTKANVSILLLFNQFLFTLLFDVAQSRQGFV